MEQVAKPIEREGQVKIDKVVNALKAGQVDEAL